MKYLFSIAIYENIREENLGVHIIHLFTKIYVFFKLI